MAKSWPGPQTQVNPHLHLINEALKHPQKKYSLIVEGRKIKKSAWRLIYYHMIHVAKRETETTFFPHSCQQWYRF